MGITADFTGAYVKTETMKAFPQATTYQLRRFGSDSVKALQIRAGQMQKGLRKTSALARSVGFQVDRGSGAWKFEIGTGLGSAKYNQMAEKYARIQDQGGTIYAKKGFLMTRKNWGHSTWVKKLVFQTKDKKWHMVDKVTIPASHWFSATMDNRMKFLPALYLNDKVIWETAQKMRGGANA